MNKVLYDKAKEYAVINAKYLILKASKLEWKCLTEMLYEFADSQIAELETENRLLDERCNQLLKDKGELTDKIEKLKADLNEAIEDANRWEETETFSVLNRIYNDNFEVITSVSN